MAWICTVIELLAIPTTAAVIAICVGNWLRIGDRKRNDQMEIFKELWAHRVQIARMLCDGKPMSTFVDAGNVVKSLMLVDVVFKGKQEVLDRYDEFNKAHDKHLKVAESAYRLARKRGIFPKNEAHPVTCVGHSKELEELFYELLKAMAKELGYQV